jgi:hypothetical protein
MAKSPPPIVEQALLSVRQLPKARIKWPDHCHPPLLIKETPCPIQEQESAEILLDPGKAKKLKHALPKKE